MNKDKGVIIYQFVYRYDSQNSFPNTQTVIPQQPFFEIRAMQLFAFTDR